MKKLASSLTTTTLIIVAFLCGKYFADSYERHISAGEPPRVFIEQLKTKMNIRKNRNDIEIFLNGTKMTDDIKLNIK